MKMENEQRTPLVTRAFGAATGAVAPFARFRAGRAAQNAITRGHTAVLRRFGLIQRIGSAPTLLLTTTGRRTRQTRTTPLMYVPSATPVLVASNGGSPTHPSWYLNLVADPHAFFEIDGERLAAVARTVEGAEREQLWERAVDVYPAYESYQRRTSRQLPVVVLEPER